jgi:1-acyl-sn-glycerol-3-phosphate acyltransferase
MTQSESISTPEFQLVTSSSARAPVGIGNVELTTQLPQVSRPLLRWFTWYSRRYVRRHFHAVRISLKGWPPPTLELPLVIYSNHASWWDALVCLVLKEQFFPGYTAFAPMDAAMLARYKFFGRLGFFGVEQHSRRGAVQFLRTGKAILESPRNILAITPQGRFVDVRQRPVCFESGLGHLATRVQRALFVPFAAEYVFWEERLPEILVRFGEPVVLQGRHRPAFAPRDWTKLFEEKLTDTQGALAAEAQRRNPAEFQVMLRGGAGPGGVYDLWRSLKSKWRGEIFRKEHGDK